MSEQLPNTLSPTRAAIIVLLHDSKFEPNTTELKKLAAENGYEHLVKKVASNIYPFSNEGTYVKPKIVKGQKRYVLTPHGLRVAKSLINNPGEIRVVESKVGRKKGSTPRQEEQQEIKFESLNLSSNATDVANSLTNLIQENQNYRNLLLHIRETIDRALGNEGTQLGED